MDEPNLQTVPHERSVDLAATQQPPQGGEQARSSHLVAPRWGLCWPVTLAASLSGRQGTRTAPGGIAALPKMTAANVG